MVATGDEAAVEMGLAASRRVAGELLQGELFLPAVHPGVIAALREPAWERWDALAIVETTTIAAGITVADLAAKRADVTVAQIRIDDGMGGRASVRLIGPIGEIESAMAAATAHAEANGTLIRAVTIPNPHEDLREHLAGRRSAITWA
jgi:microcompartment protein CcmL/EutN